MSMASVDSFSSASPSLKREDTRPVDRRRALSTELPASVQRRPASAKVPAPRALPVEISFLIAYGVPEEVL